MHDPSLDSGLTWDENGIPFSSTYADTYFDRADGLSESTYVFVEGCDLAEQWRGRHTFTVGELGFGTGLNFLAAWQAWRQSRDRSETLHYVAVEGSPLSKDDLRRATALFPQISDLAAEIVEAYPPPHRGFHRIWLNNDKVCLTLLIGDVDETLPQVGGSVDAWFLDGFAPDRNPAMWSATVLGRVASLSSPGARLATYSAAGKVRRGLEEVGFNVIRRPGHGKKRHALSATFESSGDIEIQAPWFSGPMRAKTKPGHVAVIGAGIAGASIAHAARRRGIKVTVIDKAGGVASEASSVEWAVLSPRLTAAPSDDADFYAQAWLHAMAHYRAVHQAAGEEVLKSVGTLIVSKSAEESERHCKIINQNALPPDHITFLDRAAASAQAGVALPFGGLFLPHGGLLNMSRACHSLLHDIDLKLRREVGALEHLAGHWKIVDSRGEEITTADAVVVASGTQVASLEQAARLPLTGRLGQLSSITATPESDGLSVALAGAGTVTPLIDGRHVVGATFDHIELNSVQANEEPTAAADTRNLTETQSVLPNTFGTSEILSDRGWANVRCTTPDHLPVAGALPMLEQYPSLYGDLHHGRHWQTYAGAPYFEGLYVLSGLGARGAISAPICAELVLSQIHGDPLPVPQRVADALHPARFEIRALKRQGSEHP